MTSTTFNYNQLKPKDKIWYEAGFPDIRPGTIKERRVLHTQAGTRFGRLVDIIDGVVGFPLDG